MRKSIILIFMLFCFLNLKSQVNPYDPYNIGNKNKETTVSKNDQKDASSVSEKNSFNIAIGYGNSYGGSGLNAQIKFNSFAIHAGTGIFTGSLFSNNKFSKYYILYSAGLQYYFLRNSKFLTGTYLDLQFGSFGIYQQPNVIWDYWGNYSETFTTKYMFGPSLLIGYDIRLLNNLYLNLGIGLSYNIGDKSYLSKNVGAIDMGLKYRF